MKIHRHLSSRTILIMTFAFCLSIFCGFIAMRDSKTTSAASTANFNAGNIITDAVMGNYNSMSINDIQHFLTAKNPCDNRDYNYYLRLSANKNYTWHWDNGHFVCLSEERFGDSANDIGYGQTAAEIIYYAAQDYRINPQVLLVLLQKETSLITDKIPNNGDYRKATGYGCPDTAACDSKYYGFKNQVRNAAKLYRTVLDGGWSNYPAGKTVYVQYNPNKACGGSNVYIANRATSALYRYTPYQPNQSALNAGYGAGDSCGAYGNRNFYLYFTDWFGSTQLEIPTAKHQVITDGVYTLVSGATYNTALTASGKNSGSNVSMNTRGGTDVQKWQVTYHGTDSTYSFINPATGLALNLHDANTTSGANIEVAKQSNTCGQKWRAVMNGDGTFGFVSACLSTIALDVYGASSSNGANVQSFSYHGQTAQKWRLVPDATLADGVYSISPAHSNILTLDVFGGYTTPQTNVQVYPNHESAGEKWRLAYDSQDGTYKITSLGSGLSLDVYGGYTASGTNVQMYNYHGSCGQRWHIVPNSKGYTITSVCSGLSLDVYGGYTASGTNVQLFQQTGSDNQTWKIAPAVDNAVTTGPYQIIAAANHNLVLDAGSANQSGENVRIATNQNSHTQKWNLTHNSDDDTYFITNANSGLSLDVYGGYTADETNIQLFTTHYGQNQKWKLEKNSNGTYTIRSVNSNKPLDVYGGGTVSGSNVQQYSWHGGANQQWQIVKK